MNRVFWQLIFFLLPALAGFQMRAESETRARLACYHYDPKNPYIEPDATILYSRVVSARPLLGSLRGSFFVAGKSETYEQSRTRCNSEIPRGRSLLKMTALMQEKLELPISFEENKRAHEAFKRIVVFGDSLSEEGKAVHSIQKMRRPFARKGLAHLSRISGCRIPESFMDFGIKPYWNGMFSNGPMWPRYFSEFMGDTGVDNRAFGGTTTGRRKCHPIHLQSMIDRHLKAYNNKPEVVAENLYLIWLGSNNYVYPGGVPSSKSRDKERVSAVARAMKDLTKSVESLFEKGAKHVVLFTLPNPIKSPSWLFSSDEKRFEEEKAEWRKTVALHNNTLRQKHREMGAKYGRQVSLFQLDTIIDDISQEISMDFDVLWKDEFGKRKYDEWMQQAAFFDPAHPTTKVQCVIAAKLLQHLQKAGIITANANWLNTSTSCEQKISALSSHTSTSSKS